MVTATARTIITYSRKRKKSADFGHHKKTGAPALSYEQKLTY